MSTTHPTTATVLSRRTFCATVGLCAGSLAFTHRLPAQTASAGVLGPFARYEDLLETLRSRGHRWRVLGCAPDQSPIVAVKTGGEKLPAILISAGSHSTEHAGVVAAVESISRIQTDHAVWVLPCRDPIGLAGFRHALSLGLGELPDIATPAEADSLLRSRGEVIHEAGEIVLAVIGEYGYSSRGLYRQIEPGAAFLEPLRGRRIYFPSRTEDMPGAGPLERAYTLVVTPEGELLHLNRFHDTAWAPAEVRALRQLMAEIRPGLTFDLHEHGGGGHFWMSARRQRTEEDEVWELRMAREAAAAVAATGAEMAPADYSPGSFFERLDAGLYWLNPQQRGEGLNLADFASARYGQSYTIETGMRGPFERRVRQHLLVVQTAVDIFAERFA